MGWLWRCGQAAAEASPVTWFQVVKREAISGGIGLGHSAELGSVPAAEVQGGDADPHPGAQRTTRRRPPVGNPSLPPHLPPRFVPLSNIDYPTLHIRRSFGSPAHFEGPDAPSDVAGVMIGYPGMDKPVISARGVHRAQIHVHGVASHSGASRSTPQPRTRSTRPLTSSANSPQPSCPTVSARTSRSRAR